MMRIVTFSALFIGALALATAMHQKRQAVITPCIDGGQRCAAAETPVGMRGVYKGQRMIQPRWHETTNRESGAPDIGVKADWQPFLETR